jgi:prepilin-type processing-associated H-X9-DG protein
MFDCPSDTTRVSEVDFWPYWGASNNISYGYNEKLGGNWHSGTEDTMPGLGSVRIRGHKISALRKSSKDIVICDVDRKPDAWINYYIHWKADVPYADRSTMLTGMPHHDKGNNYAFVDGHVKFYSSLDYLNELRTAGDSTTSSSNDLFNLNY